MTRFVAVLTRVLSYTALAFTLLLWASMVILAASRPWDGGMDQWMSIALSLSLGAAFLQSGIKRVRRRRARG
jgi:hypothetical protein